MRTLNDKNYGVTTLELRGENFKEKRNNQNPYNEGKIFDFVSSEIAKTIELISLIGIQYETIKNLSNKEKGVILKEIISLKTSHYEKASFISDFKIDVAQKEVQDFARMNSSSPTDKKIDYFIAVGEFFTSVSINYPEVFKTLESSGIVSVVEKEINKRITSKYLKQDPTLDKHTLEVLVKMGSLK